MPAQRKPPTTAKRFPRKTPAADSGRSAAALIDARFAALQDWRGELLARLRRLVLEADPAIVEEWKWNVPVWSCQGILCTGEVYKQVVKLTFAKGAALVDASGLFNASLDGNVRRAIDFPAGSQVDPLALQALVRSAVRHNQALMPAGRGKASS